MQMPGLFANSLALSFLSRVISGSRAVKLLVTLGSTAIRVVDGSRFVDFLRVNDYLAVDRSELRSMNEKAMITRALGASVRRTRDQMIAAWNSPARRESLLIGFIYGEYLGLKCNLSRRNMLILTFAFMLGFYLVYLTAVVLTPAAEHSLTWSAGLCLSLLLILVLMNLAGINSQGVTGARKDKGLIQSLAQRCSRFVSIFSLTFRHFKIVLYRMVFGSGPPVEGGDV